MLERPFIELYRNLTNLRGSFREVQAAATHDETLGGEVKGLLEALDAVMLVTERARKAARLPVDVDVIRRALPRCQRQLSLLKERYYEGIGASGDLDTHRAEGREELAWYITRCQAALYAAEWSISVCWGEVGEYSVLNPGGAVPGIVPPEQ